MISSCRRWTHSPVSRHPVASPQFAYAWASPLVIFRRGRSSRSSRRGWRANTQHRLDRATRAVAKIAHAVCTRRSLRSSTSHEVLAPSALGSRDALSGAAKLRTIPLRPWLAASPRERGLAARQLAHAVFRLAKVMRCCSAWGRRWRIRLIRVRRVDAAAKRDHSPSVAVDDRLCGRDRGNRVVRARAIPSRQAPPRCFRRSKRVMRRRDLRAAFRYPRGSSFRGRAGRSGPSLLLPPGGAHGVRCPSQVCSRKRVEMHFCISGPTCPFDRVVRTDWFSSGDSFPRPSQWGRAA